MNKLLSMITLLFSLGTVIAGCSGNLKENVKGDKSYNFAVSTPVQSLDSKVANDPTSQLVLNNVMEGLYKLDSKGKIVPSGAVSLPDISNDGLRYTIKLRKNAFWSDGSSVSADDYVYSWRRSVSSKDCPNISFFEAIKNAEKVNNGTMKPEELGISSKDKYTLIIDLERKTPFFTSMLVNTAFLPQKQEIVEKEGKNYGVDSDRMVYNGPYVLKSLNNTAVSEKWKMEKNTKYWDKKAVQMNKINMDVIKDVGTGVSLFEAEKLDDVPVSGEYAKQNVNSNNYVSEKSDSALYLEMNHKNSDLKNIHLRRAISSAIDRKHLIDNVVGNGSTPLTSVLTESLQIADVDTFNTYNLDRAKKELEIAKRELNKSELNFEVLTNDQELGKKSSEYIQDQLSHLEGVKVTIVPVPATVQYERLSNKEFELSISGIAADYPDPYSILSNFRANNPLNHGSYASKRYEELLKASLEEEDSSKRDKLLKQAEETINKDVGVVPLLQLNSARLRNSDVAGINSNSIGPKYDFKYMKWK